MQSTFKKNRFIRHDQYIYFFIFIFNIDIKLFFNIFTH
jgi:hypothetical protein